MNHTAYAKTIFHSRNFKVQKADIEDVVQSALTAALSKGVNISDNAVKGFIFVSCVRFMQTTCRKKQTERVKPTHSIGESTQLEGVIKSEQLDDMLNNVNSLPDYLKIVVNLTLSNKDATEIAAVRGVRPQTVRGDRCRAVNMLRQFQRVF